MGVKEIGYGSQNREKVAFAGEPPLPGTDRTGGQAHTTPLMELAGSAGQPFRMVTSDKTVQLGSRYQNPCADSSHLQVFISY
jgi:hypothetical protein